MKGRPRLLAGFVALAICLPLTAADVSQRRQQAKELLARGDWPAAVAALEQALPDAEGDPELLALLRHAYRLAVADRMQAGDRSAAEMYLRRLRLIESINGSADSALGRQTGPLPAAAESPWTPSDGASRPAAKIPGRRPGRQPAASPAVQVHLLGTIIGLDGNAEAAPAIGQWSSLRRQADELFEAKRYEEAARLYEQLHQGRAAAGTADRLARHRWAYCRLVGVIRRMNRRPQSSAEWEAIRAETASLLKLVPGNAYVQSLHRLACQYAERQVGSGRSEPAVVRAAAPDRASSGRTGLLAGLAARITAGLTGNGRRTPWRRFRLGRWQVLETSNFRVHYTDQSIAGPVADVAERARIELYRTWFGRTPRADWRVKCDIYVYSSSAAYARATGQGPASPGHSATRIERGRVISRRVDLRRDAPDLVTAVLPHEITHVVMADRFAARPLPRWADEGLAVLSEPPEKKRAHLRNLGRLANAGPLFSCQQLMTMGSYPPGNQWPQFYAESVSLVDFLVQQHGPTQFIDFMAEALQHGYSAALRQVYGYRSFRDLERAWAQARQRQVAEAMGREPPVQLGRAY